MLHLEDIKRTWQCICDIDICEVIWDQMSDIFASLITVDVCFVNQSILLVQRRPYLQFSEIKITTHSDLILFSCSLVGQITGLTYVLDQVLANLSQSLGMNDLIFKADQITQVLVQRLRPYAGEYISTFWIGNGIGILTLIFRRLHYHEIQAQVYIDGQINSVHIIMV